MNLVLTSNDGTVLDRWDIDGDTEVFDKLVEALKQMAPRTYAATIDKLEEQLKYIEENL